MDARASRNDGFTCRAIAGGTRRLRNARCALLGSLAAFSLTANKVRLRLKGLIAVSGRERLRYGVHSQRVHGFVDGHSANSNPTKRKNL
jgi:hypothetical protein